MVHIRAIYVYIIICQYITMTKEDIEEKEDVKKREELASMDIDWWY